jgi:hypothetical protein
MNTPQPALPRPARLLKSAATARASDERLNNKPKGGRSPRERLHRRPGHPAGVCTRTRGGAIRARFVMGILHAVFMAMHHGTMRVWLMVVKREESFEEKEGQEADRRPVDRCDRSHPDGFRHHVKKGSAQHRAGRKAQVDL